MRLGSELQLLGTPGNSWSESVAVDLPAKAYVLAALLLIHYRGPVARSLLLLDLWEDLPAKQRSAAMRQLVARVRRFQHLAGITVFEITPTKISISSEAPEIDVAELMATTKVTNSPDLEKLLGLYRGPLLAGLMGVGVDLQRTIEADRRSIEAHWRNLVVDAAKRIGGGAAINALRRLHETLPYDNLVCRRLLEALAVAGMRSELTGVFQAFRSRLRDHLQQEPSAETEEAYLRLTRKGPAEHQSTDARTAPSSQQTGSPTSPAYSAVPRLAILSPTRMPGTSPKTASGTLVSALLEDVTIGLCRLRSVAMIAPYTAWQLSRPKALQTVATFGIDYVLETQLGEDPAKVGGGRFSVKLVHVATRQIAWADKFDLSPGDAPDRYRNLTNWIVRTLADAIEQAELVRHSEARDPTAYVYYLRARQHKRALDLPNLRRARKLFSAAIERSPEFSLPYSGMARTYIFEWVLRAQSNPDLLQEALKLSKRAVALDPFNGDAHREFGRAALYLKDLDTSLEGFERAEQYAPHHADMLADFADALMHNSDPEEAARRIKAALTLNPMAPYEYLWTAGAVDFFLKRYDEALALLGRMKNQDPAMKLMAATAIRAGDKGAARRYRERALALNPDFNLEDWTNQLPQRDARHRKDYADALKAAGFH